VVALARHGQTAFNAEGRFQGHLPVPLDETGRAQAQELAAAAAQRRWAALWCSPLERAAETARVVAEAVGLDPRPDARFAETDCGDWTGRSFAEVQAEDPDGFEGFTTMRDGFRFPGGESFDEQRARVLDGLADVRAGALPALVVCHRGVIRLALGSGPLHIDNAALVELP
jgi:broad specificity phosphatase PhoE